MVDVALLGDGNRCDGASTANNWADWSGNITLLPGTNIIQAYSVDTSAIFHDGVSGFGGSELGRHSLHPQRLGNK